MKKTTASITLVILLLPFRAAGVLTHALAWDVAFALQLWNGPVIAREPGAGAARCWSRSRLSVDPA